MFNKSKYYILAFLCSMPLWVSIAYCYLLLHQHFQIEAILFQTEKTALSSMNLRKKLFQSQKNLNNAQEDTILNELQNFSCLEEEKKDLSHLVNMPAFQTDPVLLSRRDFLEHNQFMLIKKQDRTNTYQLKHPVEINTSDLHQLLEIFEQNKSYYNCIQFSLKREKSFHNNFLINFSIVQKKMPRPL